MTGSYTVERVADAAGLEEAWALRFAVFCDEQGVPRAEEIDALDTDPSTSHVLVRAVDGTVVGTGRLLVDDTPGDVHIGRVAVAARARGTRVGALVMDTLEQWALAENAATAPTGSRVVVRLSAQTQAEGFYRRCGYEVEGPVYLDAGIDHRDGVKVLTA
ncbi:GNAT family N-acetyltransferase [Paraoerskovia marina]|uniref:GNAT family N-acetyltransferase n=1 Tax=Paraoerskovia marina TaxID=545619 RepID=UPI000492A72E|nr:GNAT family N-acetyltransferase [Paraoerskovia marina]